MLGDALSFPRRSDDWIKTVLIGGVLSILGGFLVVPILPVQGLMVRVLDAGVRDEKRAPVFENWGELFVDGLLLFVVQFVYLLLPLVLFVIGTFVAGAGVAASSGGATGTATGLGLVGGVVFLLATLLALVAAYLLPAALSNFAYEDEFAAAFDIGTVRRAAFTGDYFVAVVLAIVVGAVLGTIAALLTVLIVGIFLTFYVQMTLYFLFGRGFGKALGIEGPGPEEPSGRPEPDPLT